MELKYGYDMCLRPRGVARALCKLVELAPPKRRVPLLEVTLPGGDRLTLPFTSNEYVESQAHGRLTEGGDVGDEPHVRAVGPACSTPGKAIPRR
ncbi:MULTISPECIES: hypothetical protein [unclassified Streptomyces]|uniref:hypothetical protein n=1 Tax=unclassified Streptomyces TaxID=2593676 RepID=UPI0015EB5B91|nr:MULTISPECIES: hypothetical protein [unclassified Streptomyces]